MEECHYLLECRTHLKNLKKCKIISLLKLVKFKLYL